MKKAPLSLSTKDQGVPKGFISLYEVFVTSNALNYYFEKPTPAILRREMFLKVQEEYNKCKYVVFSRFFNMYVDELVRNGTIPFAKCEKFYNLCFYIRAFQRIVKKKNVKTNEVSFGFDPAEVGDYLNAMLELRGRFHNVEVKDVEPVFRDMGRFAVSEENVKYGRIKYYLGNNKFIHIERNALVRQFEDFCVLNRMSRNDACLRGMAMFINATPTKDLKPIEHYMGEVEIQLDPSGIPGTRMLKKPYTKIDLVCPIEGNVYRTAIAIVNNYNNDPKNAAFGKKRIGDFVEEALNEAIKRVPLDYVNKTLAKDASEIILSAESEE